MPAVPASAARVEAESEGASRVAELGGESLAELEELVSPAGELLCGPGSRMAEFARVARALDAPEPARAPAHFEHAEGLIEQRAARGLLLLDLDALAREDWGYARRFLRLHPAWELRCCGSTEARAAFAYFGADERARLDWPPDLEQCRALRASSEACSAPIARAECAARAAAAPHAELSVRVDSTAEPRTTAGHALSTRDQGGLPRLPARALDPSAARESDHASHASAVGGPFDGLSVEACAEALAQAEPAERLELSFTRLIEELDRQGGLSAAAQACAHEVRSCVERARLERSGVLAPPSGELGATAAHELSAVVEERLAQLAPMPETAVRFLPRVRGPLHVLAQRAQLARALDGLLLHARGSAQAGTLVRVRGRRSVEQPTQVELELEYVPPAGTLALPDRRALGELGELVCERSPTGRALLRLALPAAES